MPGVKLHDTGPGSDASALHLGGGGEVFCADAVRRRFLLPGDLARWLREGRERLPGEAGQCLLGRDLVAVLEKELPDHLAVDADGAVVARPEPRRGLGADEIGLGLSGVGHHRGHLQQLAHAVIDPGFGDDHPAVGVAAQDDRPDDLSAIARRHASTSSYRSPSVSSASPQLGSGTTAVAIP